MLIVPRNKKIYTPEHPPVRSEAEVNGNRDPGFDNQRPARDDRSPRRKEQSRYPDRPKDRELRKFKGPKPWSHDTHLESLRGKLVNYMMNGSSVAVELLEVDRFTLLVRGVALNQDGFGYVRLPKTAPALIFKHAIVGVTESTYVLHDAVQTASATSGNDEATEATAA